ncbi:MAG: 30S ribosomal protein S16 [Bdellovibrionales bacterium]|jgi:small subunit ribosomal protein S16|nr:30S ribosomal protein S16 [Bdellovibrionales bacterium]MBT3524859.1 30S ribosomal protein S16 [Bdellovibrionales bacterium]MBT7669551.1 30S ribosomal protein S16 [Bdellovibrionales bacterium]MBT7767222.1 30S ribosomal protein S16 [Bdellovibrionales bacterium]
MIKIRLARGGRSKKPVYSIVAADSRFPRDGRYLERLGQYDPNREELLTQVNAEGIGKWVAKGAILSDTVRSLLKAQKIEIQ